MTFIDVWLLSNTETCRPAHTNTHIKLSSYIAEKQKSAHIHSLPLKHLHSSCPFSNDHWLICLLGLEIFPSLLCLTQSHNMKVEAQMPHTPQFGASFVVNKAAGVRMQLQCCRWNTDSKKTWCVLYFIPVFEFDILVLVLNLLMAVTVTCLRTRLVSTPTGGCWLFI